MPGAPAWNVTSRVAPAGIFTTSSVVAGRVCRPCTTTSESGSELWMVTWISVPSTTRIIGPGTSGARPSSANACISILGPLSASGEPIGIHDLELELEFAVAQSAGRPSIVVRGDPRRRRAGWGVNRCAAVMVALLQAIRLC